MAAVGVGAGELLWHLCDARAVTAALSAHFGQEYDAAVAHLLARGLLHGLGEAQHDLLREQLLQVRVLRQRRRASQSPPVVARARAHKQTIKRANEETNKLTKKRTNKQILEASKQTSQLAS